MNNYIKDFPKSLYFRRWTDNAAVYKIAYHLQTTHLTIILKWIMNMRWPTLFFQTT